MGWSHPARDGPGRIERPGQRAPALRVAALQLRQAQRHGGGADDGAGLEHEGHGPVDVLRMAGIGVQRLLEGRGIGAVTAHAIVQRRPARQESFGLRVVRALDQTHEFTGAVAMKPRRPEGVGHGQPAGRKNDEIDAVHARRVAGRLQDQEDGGVRMVETHGAHGVEGAQIVLVRRIVAVPCDDVQRRMVDGRAPQPAGEFRQQFEVAAAIFESGRGRLEIP